MKVTDKDDDYYYSIVYGKAPKYLLKEKNKEIELFLTFSVKWDPFN